MPVVDKRENQGVGTYPHIRVDYSVTVFPEGEYCAEIREQNDRIFKRNQERLPGEKTIEKEIVQHVLRGIDAIRYNINAGKTDAMGRPLPEQWEVLDPDVNLSLLIASESEVQQHVRELENEIKRLRPLVEIPSYSIQPKEITEILGQEGVKKAVDIVEDAIQEVTDVKPENVGIHVNDQEVKLKPGKGYPKEVKEAVVKLAGEGRNMAEVQETLQVEFRVTPTEQTIYKWLADAGVKISE